MADLDAWGLAFYAAPFLLLALGFVVPALAFAGKPGCEEGRGIELGLHVAKDLGGGDASGFMYC